jgi:hypothetical protein
VLSFPITLSTPASATASASLLCCDRIDPIKAEDALITMARAPIPKMMPTATVEASANPLSGLVLGG